MLFSRNIKISCDLRTFSETLAEKQCFLVRKCTITWCIAYYAELNLQICNYLQKRQICCEDSKYGPDENCVAIFAFPEREGFRYHG